MQYRAKQRGPELEAASLLRSVVVQIIGLDDGFLRVRHYALAYLPVQFVDPSPDGRGVKVPVFAGMKVRQSYLANRYAPPFSTERWKAGRACIRVSQAFRFG
jgi:hypothetical protein